MNEEVKAKSQIEGRVLTFFGSGTLVFFLSSPDFVGVQVQESYKRWGDSQHEKNNFESSVDSGEEANPVKKPICHRDSYDPWALPGKTFAHVGSKTQF